MVNPAVTKSQNWIALAKTGRMATPVIIQICNENLYGKKQQIFEKEETVFDA